MNQREEALTKMYATLKAELTTDNPIYENDLIFKAEVAVLFALIDANTDAGKAAHAINVGFSDEKLEAKQILSDIASNLAGRAFYKLNKLGKFSISEQLNTEPNEYMRATDTECPILAQLTLDIIKANWGDIGKTVISDERMEELQKALTDFVNAKGSSAVVHEVSPTLTKRHKESFAPVTECIEYLKLLIRDFKKTNLDFYDRFMASTIVPPVHVRHTSLTTYVTEKTTGKPVPEVLVTSTRSNKSALTDENGTAEIVIMKAGEDTITGTLDGKQVFSEKTHIKRGSANHLEVEI